MAMPATVPIRRFTVDDLATLPDDGNRYELLDGVLLVTPAPGLAHQSVAAEIAGLLYLGLRREPGVRVWAPGVIRARPDLELQPDILVGRDPGTGRWEEVRDRWLAVEVSGRSSRLYDREYKRDTYLALGVAEVWLVDLAAQRVFVSRQGGIRDEAVDHELVWRTPAGPALRFDVAAFFTGVAAGDQ